MFSGDQLHVRLPRNWAKSDLPASSACVTDFTTGPRGTNCRNSFAATDSSKTHEHSRAAAKFFVPEQTKKEETNK